MSTSIEWTDETWNPTTGCDKVSPGCDNCYALTMAQRLKAMGSARYQRDGDPRTSGPGFAITVHPTVVNEPLGWRKPRRVFVNSMSDLFHAGVPRPWLADIFAVMAAADWHVFQVLTKRSTRMRRILTDPEWVDAVRDRAIGKGLAPADWQWPIPGVWLGVSAEDQKRADLRVPDLLGTPAAVRFISAEPLLGPIRLHAWPYAIKKDDGYPPIDWVIVGGESGPGARPMHPDWARSLRDQCTRSGTAFFFKQWGGRTPKSAGRELDGRTWDQYPGGGVR